MIDSFHKYPIFPDLLENQRRSIRFFWEKGILDELELFSTLIGYQKEKNISSAASGGLKTLLDQPVQNNMFLPGGGGGPPVGTPSPAPQFLEKKNGAAFSTSTGGVGEVRPPPKAAPPKSWVFNGIKVYSFYESNSPLETIKLKKQKSHGRRPRGQDSFTPLGKQIISDENQTASLDVRPGNSVSKEVFGPPVVRSQKRSINSLQFLQKTHLAKVRGGYPPSNSLVKGGLVKCASLPGTPSKQKNLLFNFNAAGKIANLNSGVPPDSSSKNDTSSLVLHGSKFLLKAPQYSQIESIRYQKTYSVGLYLPIERKTFPTKKLGRPPVALEAPGELRARKLPKKTNTGDTFGRSFGRYSTSPTSEASAPPATSLPKTIQSGPSLLSEAPQTFSPHTFWFYFGDIPLMTDRGSFIINGAPRVLVNQIIRCPSVYFKVKLDQKNRRTYTASFLSEYGSWLRLETDRLGNRLWARIDKSPRFPADVLLMGLGYILEERQTGGYPPQVRSSRGSPAEGRGAPLSPTSGLPLTKRTTVENGGYALRLKNKFQVDGVEKVTAKKPSLMHWSAKPASKRSNNLQSDVGMIPGGKILGHSTDRSVPSMFSPQPGSVAPPNDSPPFVKDLSKNSNGTLEFKGGPSNPLASVLISNHATKPDALSRFSPAKNSLTEGGPPVARELVATEGPRVALQTIWKKCNPGRWTSSLGCYSFFYNKFLNPKRYSIGRVGRLRLNKRLLRNPECNVPTLTPEDVLLAFHYLTQLRSSDSLGNTGEAPLELDDIDHLKNRRVRLPGEILQNQFRLALSRITFSAIRFQDFAGERPKVGDLTSKTIASTFSPGTFGRPSGRKTGGVPPPSVSVLTSKDGQGDLLQLPPQPKLRGGGVRGAVGGPPSGAPLPAFQNTIRELFNTGQLSQYMDQTNPLAEITHKRRLSSLGPGGVGRDQAGFAVREIHPSHFGRICPIETPEGQNAGLVGSLASYARINSDGFLQSPAIPIEQQRPYLVDMEWKEARSRGVSPHSTNKSRSYALRNKKVRSKVSLFSSELEDEIYVCTADTVNPVSGALLQSNYSSSNSGRGVSPPSVTLEADAFFLEGAAGPRSSPPALPNFFPVRYKQEFLNIKATDALALTSAPTKLFTGVCPIQLISIATSLIPFLEHDDANRALMGSNMQRQAVPFMVTEKAFVGTGLELQAARDSSTVVLAKKSGEILFVDSNIIQVQEENKIESYELTKFVPSNQSTSLKQRPAVQTGEWVEKGFLLADGSGTCDGEVALGKNVLLAYMPWEGYNFEDAIVINERLVFEDIYTSIHVERFEVDVKNTKIISFRELPGRFGPKFEGGGELRSLPTVFAPPPGEYLTSDLDIITGTVGGYKGPTVEPTLAPGNALVGASEWGRMVKPPSAPKSEFLESGVPTGSFAPPRDWASSENFLFNQQLLPMKLRHLDARGIVKPGTWVQEGDILVGKVQIGSKEGGDPHQRSAPSTNLIENPWGASELSPSKTSNSPQKNPTLPFPEYRLLLAIFDLQNRDGGDANNRGAQQRNEDLRSRDHLLAAEKKLLEREMAIRGSSPPVGKGGPSVAPSLADIKTTGTSFAPTKDIVRSSPGSFAPPGQMHSIKNTSYKVGIGVRGRVLECVIEGQLPQYYGELRKRAGGTNDDQFNKALGERSSSGRHSGRAGSPLPSKNKPLSGAQGGGPWSLTPPAPFSTPPETSSSVSIFLAHKKRIQLGDKMSGRHGNKGIVSLILPPQDMPYLQDGKSVDVVLNPLGVPSRMNVGQVLETLFGLSAFYSKKIYRIMPFDERIVPQKDFRGLQRPRESSFGREAPRPETSRSLVYGYLKKLRDTIRWASPLKRSFESTEGGYPSKATRFFPENDPSPHNSQLDWLFDANNPGKTQVFDGRTGDIFYQPVLVGYSYMFKLIHLVDDKIHARSTGPYSLVTQQPLGGRSKKGGQRLGEMEVWALEGFGTASILQEFLTVKSDEIYSRNHFLFHLMRRNWDSLEKIPGAKPATAGVLPTGGYPFQPRGPLGTGIEPSTESQIGGVSFAPQNFSLKLKRDSSLSTPSKLPESFRVLINELHALCLSVYSNLPN